MKVRSLTIEKVAGLDPRGVTLQNLDASVLLVLGPNGAGKSTLLRMLAGLEAPSEGDILMDGRVMNHVPAHERDTPLVWQSLALFPFLTARENVEFKTPRILRLPA